MDGRLVSHILHISLKSCINIHLTILEMKQIWQVNFLKLYGNRVSMSPKFCISILCESLCTSNMSWFVLLCLLVTVGKSVVGPYGKAIYVYISFSLSLTMAKVLSVPKENQYPLLGMGGHNAILLYLGQPMVHRRMQAFSKRYIASLNKLKDKKNRHGNPVGSRPTRCYLHHCTNTYTHSLKQGLQTEVQHRPNNVILKLLMETAFDSDFLLTTWKISAMRFYCHTS